MNSDKSHSNTILCHIVKRTNFDGYGFNLHAEKGKSGHFIGKIDAGSPAEDAGLKEGDKIIEVNNHVITNESHKKVVELIKTISNETKLLVLRENSDKDKNNITIIEKDSNGNANTHNTSVADHELNLKMTASELRAKLAAKKKHDPKNDGIDIQKKYEIIDMM